MPTTFSRVLTSLGSRNTVEHRNMPMLNTITNSLGEYYNTIGLSMKKQMLMRWFKSIPELTALISKVARDIVSNYHFENIMPKQSGRNKILHANRFAMEHQLTKLMLSQVIDVLVTGEGYGWLGKISADTIKEQIDLALKYELLEKKEKNKLRETLVSEFKHLSSNMVSDSSKFSDEDNYLLKKYRAIASSTMENVYDQYTIMKYIQWVGGMQTEFSTDEILRFTFMEIDGKPFGFTPVESIVVQLELLRMMWQNQISIHKNGGSPDKIVVAKNISPQSPSYKNIYEQLQKYKLVENKHGNMLFTGDIDVIDLQQLDKMQFMDQGLYVTGLIAMQWQIPRSSIPYILGSANTKDDTGGNSEKGYWDTVELFQRFFAETMNAYLWMPYFGVRIVFDKTYIQHDIQVGQAVMQKYNNLMNLNNILKSAGKQLTTETILRETDLDSEDIEDLDLDLITEQNDAIRGMDNQMSKSSLDKGSGQENHANSKRAEQAGVNQSRGSPTGFGKEIDLKLGNEWDYDSFMEYKSITSGTKSIQEIDFHTFIKVYSEDRNYQQGMPPRIFIRPAMGKLEMEFASSDFVYRTIIDENDENSISFLNLQGANIYKV